MEEHLAAHCVLPATIVVAHPPSSSLVGRGAGRRDSASAVLVENCNSQDIVAPALDVQALLAEPVIGAAAVLASPEAADVRQDLGPAIPCPQLWQAVPA